MSEVESNTHQMIFIYAHLLTSVRYLFADSYLQNLTCKNWYHSLFRESLIPSVIHGKVRNTQQKVTDGFSVITVDFECATHPMFRVVTAGRVQGEMLLESLF